LPTTSFRADNNDEWKSRQAGSGCSLEEIRPFSFEANPSWLRPREKKNVRGGPLRYLPGREGGWEAPNVQVILSAGFLADIPLILLE